MKRKIIKKSFVFFLFLLMIAVLSGFMNNSKSSGNQDDISHEVESNDISYIYLAGPFFNETEIKNIEYAENVLTEKGLLFFSPMRHSVESEPGTAEWANDIFEMDKCEIEKSDAVVALYYGNYSDTGTAWECGYAAAIGVPVILVHVNDDGDSNLMMHCGCTTNIDLEDLETYDFDTMPVYEYEGNMY